MRSSDFLPPFRPHFVAFVWPYHLAPVVCSRIHLHTRCLRFAAWVSPHPLVSLQNFRATSFPLPQLPRLALAHSNVVYEAKSGGNSIGMFPHAVLEIHSQLPAAFRDGISSIRRVARSVTVTRLCGRLRTGSSPGTPAMCGSRSRHRRMTRGGQCRTMTPHTSGTSLSAQARYAARVREILECWLEGRPIRNEYLIIDKGKLAGAGAHSYSAGDATGGSEEAAQFRKG